MSAVVVSVLILGGVILSVLSTFVMFLAAHQKKHGKSNIAAAIVYTLIIIALFILPVHYSKNEAAGIFLPFAWLLVLLITIKAIVTLRKNISILAEHRGEELQGSDLAVRTYKRKLWIRVLLSGIFFPAVGAIIAAVFINFLAGDSKRKKIPTLAEAIFCTALFGALCVLPEYSKNFNNETARAIVPVLAVLIAVSLMVGAILKLPRNINILAGRAKNTPQISEKKSISLGQTIKREWGDIKCGWSEVSNDANTRNDTTTIARAEALRLVLRHIKTIITKCEQATYRDSYGEVKFDRVFKEIDYFIDHVIRSNLFSAQLPKHFSQAQYTKVLSGKLYKDSFINAFLKDIICQFYNAYSPWDFDKVVQNLAIKYAQYLREGRYTCSKKTLRFLLGDDYEHIQKEALSLANGANSPATATTLIHTLISPGELSNLRKWFVERNARVLSLSTIATGEEFEVFCQRQLQALGWHAQVTKTTGDFGADLVVERNGVTIIVQCKYYSKPVGVKAVQEAFSAMTFYNAHKAAVVSNQSYTRAAEQMAEKNNVTLLHVNELDRLA